MTVVVDSALDFTLQAFARVALGGEDVTLGPAIAPRMQDSFEALQEYVATHSDQFIYGVTSGGGPDASRRVSAEEMQATRRAGFGWRIGELAFGDGELEPALVRGALFATLRIMTSGYTSTPAWRAEEIVALLREDLPRLPALGITAAGEILTNTVLGEAERATAAAAPPRDDGFKLGSTNGAPMATAQLALASLLSDERLSWLERLLALSIDAFRVPLDAYDRAFAELWDDPDDCEMLTRLADLLSPPSAGDRLTRAPDSFLIVPRILGQAQRALRQLRTAATTSLAQLATNPTFVPDGADLGPARVLSNGGYHNAVAAAALDAVTASWADIAAIAHRHAIKFHKGELTGLPDRLLVGGGQVWVSAFSTTYLEYVPNDFVAELRQLAQPTLLLGGEIAASEQDDIAVNAFMAYRKLERASPLLDATMAVLAVVASQALHAAERVPAEPLRPLLEEIRALIPPVVGPRRLGPECQRLAEWLGTWIHDGALRGATGGAR